MRGVCGTVLPGLVAAAALLVAGCGGGGDSSAPKAGGKASGTITWGIYADPARDQLAAQQVKAFEAGHPGIKVKVQSVPFAQYYQKLATQLASGSAYDVMMISGAYFPKIAPQGGLEDLSPMIQSDKLDLSQYATEKANSEYQGKTFALPYELDIQGLFYNKDMFKAAGVAPPTDSWTWDDLRAAAKKLTRTGGSKKTWGFLSDNLYPSWVSFIAQAGGSVVDAQGTKATLTTPEVKAAMQFMTQTLIQTDGSSPKPGQLPAGTNAFQAGLVGMAIDGSYSVLPTLQNVKFGWDVAPLPSGPAGKGVAYWTQGIAIASTSKNKAAAWEFAKFLASQQGEEILAKSKFATPSLKSVASSPAYLSGKPANLKTFVDEFASAAKPIPFNDKWFDMMSGPSSAMGEPFAKLWEGKSTVDQATSQAQANVDKLLGG
jgi:multiple sugar transport system substrate-binding protein